MKVNWISSILETVTLKFNNADGSYDVDIAIVLIVFGGLARIIANSLLLFGIYRVNIYIDLWTTSICNYWMILQQNIPPMVRFYIVIFSGYEVLYYIGILVLWNDWKNVAFLFNIFLDVIIILSVFSYYQKQARVSVIEEE